MTKSGTVRMVGREMVFACETCGEDVLSTDAWDSDEPVTVETLAEISATMGGHPCWAHAGTRVTYN